MRTQLWTRLIILGLLLWGLWASPVAAGGPTTVTYTYDGAGRLIRAAYSDGTTIFYTYDVAGNLLSRIIEHGFTVYLPTVLRSYTD